MRIFLQFTPEQTSVHRSRIRYAFSLFCAIYGHQPIFDDEHAGSADAWISYSLVNTRSEFIPIVKLADLYSPRSPALPAPPPTSFESDGERTALFYRPKEGAHPDWLGEIFEWVSCADEYSIKRCDSIGRIAFADSYVSRHKLNVRLPYAAIAMRFLQRALARTAPACPAEPSPPVPSVRHFLISTHDVDYLPVSYWQSLRRLAKNVGMSLLLYRAPALALDQARKALLMMLGGQNPLDQVPGVVRGESQRLVKASYFFLARHRHPRDGNYRIDQPAVVELMRSLEKQGMEIGVHGSYTSLDEPQALVSECGRLRELGFQPQGGRQHWLRFMLDRLIKACEQASLLYDSSLGWSECVGFRGGACFAFPPYNFTEERAATFLEIPLAVMDVSLLKWGESAEWYDQVAEVLSLSRRYGWGGISVLWHPYAFGGGQLPPGLGEVFWRLMDHREEWKDTWVSASEFIRSARQRYIDVRLLPALSRE